MKEPSMEALKTLACDVLKQTQHKGASAAEVEINLADGLSSTVRLGSVETIEYHHDKGVGITVYFGQKKGNASSSDLTMPALFETIDAACYLATHTEADPFAGLAPLEKMAQHYPELDLYHPWNLDASTAIEIATRCEQAGLQLDKTICNSEGATLASHQGTHIYANTQHFAGGYRSSRHSLNCTLIAGTGDTLERDYDYTVARAPQDLKTPESIGAEAAKRALKRLHAQRLKTQQTPVIFAAEVASSLWGHFFSAISGGAIYRKSSFLVDSRGQKIFPDTITITEHPHIKKGLGSAPFDGEGVETQDKIWVQNGVVQDYVLESYYARKLGMVTTGNAGGLHNIRITTSDYDLAQLLQQIGQGLLVTELMGHGINKVTGDYSRGATGFWVEQGTIQYPVHEITIAGNLKTMYQQIIAIGNDIDTRGNIQSGSVWIESMMVGGT